MQKIISQSSSPHTHAYSHSAIRAWQTFLHSTFDILLCRNMIASAIVVTLVMGSCLVNPERIYCGSYGGGKGSVVGIGGGFGEMSLEFTCGGGFGGFFHEIIGYSGRSTRGRATFASAIDGLTSTNPSYAHGGNTLGHCGSFGVRGSGHSYGK